MKYDIEWVLETFDPNDALDVFIDFIRQNGLDEKFIEFVKEYTK